MSTTDPFIVTVLGETTSKENSRRIVKIGGKTRSIKALAYSEMFKYLCPTRGSLLEGDLVMGIKIYYGSRRPDLSETLVLDLLQGKAYGNDRQVKRRFADWGLDKENPRVELFIAPLDRTMDAIEYIMGLD